MLSFLKANKSHNWHFIGQSKSALWKSKSSSKLGQAPTPLERKDFHWLPISSDVGNFAWG